VVPVVQFAGQRPRAAKEASLLTIFGYFHQKESNCQPSATKEQVCNLENPQFFR